MTHKDIKVIYKIYETEHSINELKWELYKLNCNFKEEHSEQFEPFLMKVKEDHTVMVTMGDDRELYFEPLPNKIYETY